MGENAIEHPVAHCTVEIAARNLHFDPAVESSVELREVAGSGGNIGGDHALKILTYRQRGNPAPATEIEPIRSLTLRQHPKKPQRPFVDRREDDIWVARQSRAIGIFAAIRSN